MDRIAIFDTTLRDGEQAPGFSMNVAGIQEGGKRETEHFLRDIAKDFHACVVAGRADTRAASPGS